MKNVFNTPFETLLRVLLILSENEEQIKTADMIAAVDFIAVYGKLFRITDNNLNGDRAFSFSEFTARRELVKRALKRLVLDGLVIFLQQDKGFCYKISETGKTYCASLNSDYSYEYTTAAKAASTYVGTKSEREVFAEISQHSLLALRKGERNGR